MNTGRLGQARMGALRDAVSPDPLGSLLNGAYGLLDRGHHTVTFTGGAGWILRHPQDCPFEAARECPVSRAARKTLLSPEYLPGTYACHVTAAGWLRTTGGRR